MTGLDRLFLLLTGLLSAYQIAIGINNLSTLPIIAYTIGFGVMLLAGLLMIILGFEALNSPIVVIISTVIPLSLSLGLVWELLSAYRTLYLLFTILGFSAVLVTRLLPSKNRLPVMVLTLVHAVAGLVIFLVPLLWAGSGRAAPGFALVGIGGALISTGGVLLAFLKTGRPILSQETMFKILPGLLLLTTAAFVLGFIMN